MNEMNAKIDLLFQIFEFDLNDNISVKKEKKSGDIIIKKNGIKSKNTVKKEENEDIIGIGKKHDCVNNGYSN